MSNTMNMNMNVNAKSTKEGTMTNITKTVKNTVEVVRDINATGTALEYLAINGEKIAVMGYRNEADKAAAIAAVQAIVNNSDKKGYALYMEIANTLMTGAALTEEGVEAKNSEEVEIEGVPLIVNYETAKIYIGINGSLEPIADLEDMEGVDLPEQAIKALLSERAKVWLMEKAAEKAEEYVADDYDDYDDYDDDYDNYDDEDDDEYYR